MNPCARFDDHTPGSEHSFALRGLERTVIARQRDEVLDALGEVERAAEAGRWVAGYVAYEAAPGFDQSLVVRDRTPQDPFADLPLVWFGVFERREQLEPFSIRRGGSPYQVSPWQPELSRLEYDEAVAVIRERISAGDATQVSHTFRLRAAFSGDPQEMYRDLVLAQRGAHSASFDCGRYRVLSASPERFFRIESGRVAVTPMKGTIRRGRWSEEDDDLAARLLTSAKDRAENLMIVDLVRDELGRVAVPGTVHVDELLAVERYETLWQLTSNVTAELAAEAGLADVLTALFPSGSVTGSPKARAMAIVRELEPSPRGVYGGAIGYVAPAPAGGIAEFSVGIRTVVIDIEEGLAEYGVGGAITWASEAEDEFEEARLKARLLVERRPGFDLVETLRWEPGSGFMLLDSHLGRLARSALFFGFAADLELLREALDKEVAGHGEARAVRLVLRRDGTVETSSALLTESFNTDVADAPAVKIALCEDPVESTDVFLFHKTTHRSAYERRAAFRSDVDEVVLTNEHGEVTEAVDANIAVRFGDRWWTPPVDAGCLGGTYRQRLIGDGVLRERPIAAHELFAADGVALIDSVRGWRRAVLVE